MTTYSSSTDAITGSGINEKTQTVSRWNSTNNTGTITFDAINMSSQNFGYKLEGQMVIYSFDNNKVTDSTTMPISATVSPSAGTAKYKVTGSNTIKVESGVIDMDGQQQSTGDTEFKYTLQGVILTLKVDENKTTTESQGGMKYTQTLVLKSTLTFRKK